MKKLLLVNSDKQVLLDDEDYEKVKRWRWKIESKWDHVLLSESQGEGAFIPNPPRIEELIINIPSRHRVYHKNHDPFDCQKKNLVVLTNSQFEGTKPPQSNSDTGLKGVSWHKKFKRWQAVIHVNGKLQYLGRFVDIRDAARTYNDAALKYFGEYAFTNDVDHINPRLLFDLNKSSRPIKKSKAKKYMDKLDTYKANMSESRDKSKDIEVDY